MRKKTFKNRVRIVGSLSSKLRRPNAYDIRVTGWTTVTGLSGKDRMWTVRMVVQAGE